MGKYCHFSSVFGLHIDVMMCMSSWQHLHLHLHSPLHPMEQRIHATHCICTALLRFVSTVALVAVDLHVPHGICVQTSPLPPSPSPRLHPISLSCPLAFSSLSCPVRKACMYVPVRACSPHMYARCCTNTTFYIRITVECNGLMPMCTCKRRQTCTLLLKSIRCLAVAFMYCRSRRRFSWQLNA